MAIIGDLRVYPIKGLDPVPVDSVEFDESGGLAWDRKYALFSEDGAYVNGRRESRIHTIRSSYDLPARTVTLDAPGIDAAEFHLDDDRDALAAWFTAYFDEPITVKRANANYTDSAGGLSHWKKTTHGPSLITQATLEEVASWFDETTPAEMRDRFRVNLVIDDVPAFWEDQLYADEEHVVPFSVGDATLHGLRPIPRCRVPTADPETGERIPEFIERFIEHREATFPDWTDPDLLTRHGTRDRTHYYFLAVIARVPPTEYGKSITVGAPVTIQDTQPLLTTL